MKVYEIIKFECYEFENTITTKVTANEEEARKWFHKEKEYARDKAQSRYDDDELCYIVDMSKTPNHYNVYVDGSADEFEIEIWLKEYEI